MVASPRKSWLAISPVRQAGVEVLAHGQIDLSGLVTSTRSGPGTFQLAVTGGTGSYSGARGYATVVPGSAPTITIHLTP